MLQVALASQNLSLLSFAFPFQLMCFFVHLCVVLCASVYIQYIYVYMLIMYYSYSAFCTLLFVEACIELQLKLLMHPISFCAGLAISFCGVSISRSNLLLKKSYPIPTYSTSISTLDFNFFSFILISFCRYYLNVNRIHKQIVEIISIVYRNQTNKKKKILK